MFYGDIYASIVRLLLLKQISRGSWRVTIRKLEGYNLDVEHVQYRVFVFDMHGAHHVY